MNPMDMSLQTSTLPWQGQADSSQLQQLQQKASLGPKSDRQKLKQVSQEFEAVFVQQLLEAMDKTVDRTNSILSGGSAEEYFRSMLNQEVAKSMTNRPGGSGFGLAETIYKQMEKQLKSDKADKGADIPQTGDLTRPASSLSMGSEVKS